MLQKVKYTKGIKKNHRSFQTMNVKTTLNSKDAEEGDPCTVDSILWGICGVSEFCAKHCKMFSMFSPRFSKLLRLCHKNNSALTFDQFSGKICGVIGSDNLIWCA